MEILIISAKWDIHAQAVAWALQENRIPVRILDLSDFPSHASLLVSPDQPLDALLKYSPDHQAAITCPLNAIHVVWCRRMLSGPQLLNFQQVHTDDLGNVIPNSEIFLQGVWQLLAASLTHATWLNPLHAVAAAGKAMQLRTAQALGMKIPDSIIGNDPASVREFCAKHGGTIIMKALRPNNWHTAQTSRVLGTTLVTTADLAEDMPIRLCPAIFQNVIRKQYELRVVVLGQTILAAKLNSQAHTHSRLDWRNDVFHDLVAIEPYQLDQAIQVQILAFMQKMGLAMGSLDFIVDENGDLVFLEVNEQGQFLFLEKRTPKLPVLASVANYLASVAGHTGNFNWPTFADFEQSPSYMATMHAFDEAEKHRRIQYRFVA